MLQLADRWWLIVGSGRVLHIGYRFDASGLASSPRTSGKWELHRTVSKKIVTYYRRNLSHMH